MRRVHPASFGGIEFDCLSAQDAINPVVAISRVPFRKGASLRNRGSDPRSTRCEVIFFDRAPLDDDTVDSAADYLSRWRRFFVACHDGRSKDFRHPFTGGFRAKVVGFDANYSGEEPDTILATITFLEDGEPAAVAAESVSVGGSIAAINARSVAAQVEFEAIDADTLELESSSELALLWNNPDISAAQITSEARASTRRLANLQTDLELATNPDNYPAWKAVEQLIYQMRQAAEAAKRAQPQYEDVEILAPIPLRVFVSHRYGASQAERRRQEILDLNDIKDPARIDAGFRLRVPVDSSGVGLPLRGSR